MAACTITFDPNANPKFSFNPDSIPVPYGNNQVITWTLSSPNASGAQFASNGVVFKPNSGWPGPAPGPVGNSTTVFSVTDDNTNQGTLPVDYPYSVNVVYNGNPYSYDPEVANDPKGTIRHQPA